MICNEWLRYFATHRPFFIKAAPHILHKIGLVKGNRQSSCKVVRRGRLGTVEASNL
jgi:hypothetical protein